MLSYIHTSIPVSVWTLCGCLTLIGKPFSMWSSLKWNMCGWFQPLMDVWCICRLNWCGIYENMIWTMCRFVDHLNHLWILRLDWCGGILWKHHLTLCGSFKPLVDMWGYCSCKHINMEVIMSPHKQRNRSVSDFCSLAIFPLNSLFFCNPMKRMSRKVWHW